MTRPFEMNRDYYSSSHFMQLQELLPSAHPYQQFELTQASQAATPAYEMMEVGAGQVEGGGPLPPAPAPAPALPPAPQHPHHLHSHSQPHHQDSRKRSNSHFGDGYESMSACESMTAPSASPAPLTARRRKTSSYGTASAYDDDGDESRSTRTLPDKKQNHSEIEKRRRDKMNTYITELSAMVPMCGAMARKLDKLTVLRMAVQHLRSVRGALSACPLTARPRPACVSERELNALILHAAHDSFLLVVGCDRGRLLYVSASVESMLHYDQSELLGQSMFDILHPKDVAKVKEQLSSSDLSPRERLIDAKTMLPVKADVGSGASRLSPGARRSFFCRIKCKAQPESAAAAAATAAAAAQPNIHQVKEESEPAAKLRKKHAHEKKYCVVQCTGYLKSWAPAEMCESGDGGDDGDGVNVSCLVAVGRALPDLSPAAPPTPAPAAQPPPPPPPTRRLQYVSRHAIDGKYLFVDQRVTLALGYLPQELLGTSLYEYVSGAALGAVARAHQHALARREPLHTPPYAARRKDGARALIRTHFKPFRNPWTKDVECLVANNTVLAEAHEQPADAARAPFDAFNHKGDVEVQRLIDSQVESHKIGSAIAEEALRRCSAEFSPDLPADLLQDAVFNQQSCLVDNMFGADMGYQVRNNVPLSAAGACTPPPPAGGGGGGGAPACGAGSPPPPASPPLPPLAIDGNGEAAMAVIMSLLEADAGLGGPINFSGLPWPLP